MIDRLTALSHIAELSPLSQHERVGLSDCVGRVLASPVIARVTQPPAAMSAMDGYAVRFEDLEESAPLKLIGEAAAGAPFTGSVEKREAVRVFTGSVIPAGTDHVVIQEEVRRTENTISVTEPQTKRRNIRPAGTDFTQGETILDADQRLRPLHLSLMAACNIPEVDVIQKPKIGLLTNGDELVPPGSTPGPGQIISSNSFSLTALLKKWGAQVIDLGTLPDSRDRIRESVLNADVDVFVPVGGASVGDHDHMRPVFQGLGYEPIFEKVAIKPGKPTWLFRKHDGAVLGLPGNPASALVCAHLFLKPLVDRLLGLEGTPQWCQARLTQPTKPNGQRENFVRGIIYSDNEARNWVEIAANQDSSLLTPFASANALIRQNPNQPALEAGDIVDCLRLD